ncbi:MAG: cellulase family glycosylhydrolase [Chloroflexota bacterium]
MSRAILAAMKKRIGILIVLLGVIGVSPSQISSNMRLTFASDRAGNGDIFILDSWGKLTNVTQSPEGDWAPTWSPDGSTLAYTSHQNDQADIVLRNTTSGALTNLTQHPAWDYAPTWSPDGRQIAFVSERDGEAELFTQAIGETEATQRTFNNYPDRMPSWSPDGGKIAFAAVVAGREQLYVLDLVTGNIRPLLWTADLNGTRPVWSPSGNAVAFVGWKNQQEIGLYLFDLNSKAIHPLYINDQWIGSLSWSGDEEWILFTGRKNGNHELMSLHVDTRRVRTLTHHSAWDDFPVLHPSDSFHPSRLTVVKATKPHRSFGYGVNLADLSNAYLIQDIGFNYIKGYVNWATVEEQPGQFRWADPDNILRAAQGADAKILLRIHGVPVWARPSNTSLSHPPISLDDFATFMQAIGQRYRGQVAAYEIWNEPNLNYEWGYRDPSPSEYTALLKTAYQALKAVDPDVLVISAGIAPTGNGNPPESLGVVAFTEGMYAAGAKGYFDALGSHPYSYGHAPDYAVPNEITFDQVAEQRAVMLRHDDGATPVWITEMGWVLQTDWDLGVYHNQGVSQFEQAQYLRRAYEKIEQEWPWIDAAFLFNLDFSTAPWYQADEQMRWFAILNPDRTPRPAYTALRLYREEGRDQ